MTTGASRRKESSERKNDGENLTEGKHLRALASKSAAGGSGAPRRLAGDSTPVLITRTIGLTPAAEARLLDLIAAIRERDWPENQRFSSVSGAAAPC